MGRRGNRNSSGGTDHQGSTHENTGGSQGWRDQREQMGHDPRSRVDRQERSYSDNMRRMFTGQTADVTIVIRTRNAEPFLEELLQKLDNQRGGMEQEILVVDTDSQDRTPLILRSRGIRTLHVEKGAPYFDESLRVAEGDIVVFLSQDSLPLNGGWLDALTLPIRYSKDIAMVHGRLLADAAVPPYHRGLINAKAYVSGKYGLLFKDDTRGEGVDYVPSTNFAVSKKLLMANSVHLDSESFLARLYQKGLTKVYLPEPVTVIRTPKILPNMLGVSTGKGNMAVGRLIQGEAQQMVRELGQLNENGSLPDGERGEAYAISIAVHSTRMANLLLSRVNWVKKAAGTLAPVARKLLPNA